MTSEQTLADVVTEDGAPKDTPIRRLPGQDIGYPGIQQVASDRVGHKADTDSYARSKKKTYVRKVKAQKSMKGR